MKISPQTQTLLQREVSVFNTNANIVSNSKHESHPDPRFNLNVEHSQTRVSSQMQILTRHASRFKCGSEPDPRFILNADLTQTCVSTQTRACKLRVSTIEQNSRRSRFSCYCPITVSINTHIM